MSVNYKQGVNGVSEAIFVFVARRLQSCHSKRSQVCFSNIVEIIYTVPRSIPIGDRVSAAE